MKKTSKTEALVVETMALDKLIPDDKNPRTISPEALRKLEASITKFGLVQPIILNRRTGKVVGGHQRLKALRALGRTEALVMIGDWTPAEEKSLNVTLNNRQSQGEFDEDALESYMQEIAAEMNALDFNQLGLSELMKQSETAARQARSRSSDLVFKVVVECEGEVDQGQLIDELEAQGRRCSPLIS